MDTLFIEGTRERHPVLLEVKDVAALLLFLRLRERDLYTATCAMVRAHSRAEDLKALQRHSEGFAGFSSVPSAR